MKELGIYIHIPFCSSKCYYCDFVSFSKLDRGIDKYIDYLIKEMELYKEQLKDYKIKTIFIGGGTPSYIDGKNIGKILEYIHKNFNVNEIDEVTIETNPETLNEEKLNIYKEFGINRISMGVQTLNDSLLKEIGRSHTTTDFYKNYELTRKIGFDNINVDLMFGLPNQTLNDCKKTLKEIVNLGVEHISYYSLILEEKTLMSKWENEGKIEFPNEETERKMYHNGINFLESEGFKHYEISNFAKEGYECEHNLFYWQLKPYIGFGIAAHSNLNNNRFWNHNSFKNYYDSLDMGKTPVSGKEYIGREMEIVEYLIMGLRLVSGVDKTKFMNRFNLGIEDIYKDVLEKYEEQGLLYIDDERIKFTPKGLDLSNIVYVDLLP